MIRVLIADDSPTSRQLLAAVLERDPAIRIVGEARDGSQAVELTARLRPDLVLMDVTMPRMDGLEATHRIMMRTPTPIVVVSSSVNVRAVSVSLQALRAGALALLPKPAGPGSPGHARDSRELIDTVKAMAQVKVVRRLPVKTGLARPYPRAHREPPTPVLRPAVRAPWQPPARGGAIQFVAIGASTGGPAALYRILSALPAGFPLPCAIVQHIATGFVEGLAAWLGTAGPLPVKVAAHGDPLIAGRVLLAPDDQHLGVATRHHVMLSDAGPVNGFRPSASVLFETAANTFGREALAIVLTGMGTDGVSGLRAVKQSGGHVLAQDEASSVVYGMPGAAVAAGVVDDTVELARMALAIRSMTGERVHV